MLSLIRQRDEIEELADGLLNDSVDYHALRRIPGVGPIIALTILAEAGDAIHDALPRTLGLRS